MTDLTTPSLDSEVVDERQSWFAQVLRIDHEAARGLLHGEFEAQHFPQYELSSVLVAIAMLSPFDTAAFESAGKHRRLPTSSYRVQTGHDSSMKCSVPGVHSAIETADGDPVILLTGESPSGIDVLVFAADDAVKRRVLDQLQALVTGAASCWRGKRVLFTGAEACLYRHLPPVETDTIAIDAAVETELRRNLIVPITRFGTDDRLADRRGVLVHGRTGIGKTRALEWVQGSVADAATVIVTTPVMVDRSHALNDLFEMAASAAPSLIVIEDFDIAFVGRETTGFASDAMAELLSYVDGADRRRGVFVVATTNHPKVLDSAIVRRPGRFDRKIVIDDPSAEVRSAFVRSMLERIGGDDSQVDTIVARTDEWSIAEIEEAGQLAVLIALDTDSAVDVLAALDDVHRGTKGIDPEPKKPRTGYV